MTLHDRIIELTQKHPGLKSPGIAAQLGCHPAYVRTVWQRHKKRPQRTHRQVVEQMIAEFIRDDIMEAEYTEEASIMFLSGFIGFGENEERIAAELGYARPFVNEIGQRFRSSKIWADGSVAPDIFKDWNEGERQASTIIWNLCLLVAKGRACCTFNEQGERLWASAERKRAPAPAMAAPEQRRRIEPRKRTAPPARNKLMEAANEAEARHDKWREARDRRLYKSDFEAS